MSSTRSFLSCAVVLALLVSGCAPVAHQGSYRVSNDRRGCVEELDDQLRMLDLKRIFAELAKDLCPEQPACREKSNPQCREPATVLVTDFVDLQSLGPKPPGLLMGELMRSSINSVCGYTIQQAELSKFFTLSDRGLVVLTRNIESIRQDEVANSNFIVGTFSHSPEKLMLFVKRFDLDSGKITRMTTKEVDFNCSGKTVGFKVR